MASREEQETTITMLPMTGEVSIYTAYPPHIRKLLSDKRFSVQKEFLNEDGTIEAVVATTQRNRPFNIVSLAQRTDNISDEVREQRRESARRMFAKANG